MNSLVRLSSLRIFRFAATLVASGIFSAIPLSAQSTAGLVGVRHAEVSIFYESIDEAGIDDGLGFAFRATLPLHEAIDLTLSGSHEEIDTNDFRERTAFATIVAHWNARDLTPYLSGGVGNVWQTATVGNDVTYNDDEALYTVGAGLEAPVGDRTALDVRATYHKYFSGDLGHYWIYSLGLNHWLTESWGATASVSFRESDSVTTSLGAVLRF